jgi:RNA recognition motif-containing protein
VLSAQVIEDRETGRSKGFGFVEMDTEAQARAAIAGLTDREHDGRRLTVNEAKPREDRGGGGYGGGRGRGGGGYGGGYGGGGRRD